MRHATQQEHSEVERFARCCSDVMTDCLLDLGFEEQDVDDALQEVLLRWMGAPGGARDLSMSAFRNIAYRMKAERHRRSKVRREAEFTIASFRIVADRQSIAFLNLCLFRLTPIEREIVTKFRVDRQPHRLIAYTLGVSFRYVAEVLGPASGLLRSWLADDLECWPPPPTVVVKDHGPAVDLIIGEEPRNRAQRHSRPGSTRRVPRRPIPRPVSRAKFVRVARMRGHRLSKLQLLQARFL